MTELNPKNEYQLTPDSVLSGINVTKSLEVFNVWGIVTSIRPYPRKGETLAIYGTLKGKNASIEFKCPPDAAPTSFNTIVAISGTLKTEANRFETGLKVTICGDVVDSWAPADIPGYTHVQLEKDSRTYLHDLLAQHPLTSIKIISTKTAHADIKKQLSKYASELDPVFEICNFSSINALLSSAKNAINDENVKAVFFSRGGKDSTIELWNDIQFVSDLLALNIPFYTAIGHSDLITLAEKFSDESFTTPTDLGCSIDKILSELEKERKLKSVIKGQFNEIDSLNSSLESSTHQTEKLDLTHTNTLQGVVHKHENTLKELDDTYKHKENKLFKILFGSIVVNILLVWVYIL